VYLQRLGSTLCRRRSQSSRSEDASSPTLTRRPAAAATREVDSMAERPISRSILAGVAPLRRVERLTERLERSSA
jgi:hypothetical protein